MAKQSKKRAGLRAKGVECAPSPILDPLRDRVDRPQPPVQAAEGDEEVIEEDLRLKERK